MRPTNAAACVFLGRQIEHQATHVAQKLAARVVEIIVLPVKFVAVGEDHPGKTEGLILELELLGEAAEQGAAPCLSSLSFFFFSSWR